MTMKSANVFGKQSLGINLVILCWVSYKIGNDFEILKLWWVFRRNPLNFGWILIFLF